MQFDCAEARTEQGQPHFDFMFCLDMSMVAAWASAVLDNGKEDLYISASILSWLAELGHWKVAVEALMRLVKKKGDLMVTPTATVTKATQRRRANGPVNSEPDHGLQDPDRDGRRNHDQGRKPTLHMLPSTQGVPAHTLCARAPARLPAKRSDTVSTVQNLVGWQRYGVAEVKIGLRGVLVSCWFATADQTIG